MGRLLLLHRHQACRLICGGGEDESSKKATVEEHTTMLVSRAEWKRFLTVLEQLFSVQRSVKDVIR